VLLDEGEKLGSETAETIRWRHRLLFFFFLFIVKGDEVWNMELVLISIGDYDVYITQLIIKSHMNALSWNR
jgi:hypothetical protein